VTDGHRQKVDQTTQVDSQEGHGSQVDEKEVGGTQVDGTQVDGTAQVDGTQVDGTPQVDGTQVGRQEVGDDSPEEVDRTQVGRQEVGDDSPEEVDGTQVGSPEVGDDSPEEVDGTQVGSQEVDRTQVDEKKEVAGSQVDGTQIDGEASLNARPSARPRGGPIGPLSASSGCSLRRASLKPVLPCLRAYGAPFNEALSSRPTFLNAYRQRSERRHRPGRAGRRTLAARLHRGIIGANASPHPAIVAVDNDSSDGSRDLLRQALGPERVISLPENRGLPGAMRAALDHPAVREADLPPPPAR
jgi:hypothetical protein